MIRGTTNFAGNSIYFAILEQYWMRATNITTKYATAPQHNMVYDTSTYLQLIIGDLLTFLTTSRKVGNFAINKTAECGILQCVVYIHNR